ncbi:membrane protein FAM174A [Ambystoma mexicanum]|uniref:membrane protein FAM174A n=1 Tax=Ambystoma mexicanum TaxID=8296 RepID=UPI0037E8F065
MHLGLPLQAVLLSLTGLVAAAPAKENVLPIASSPAASGGAGPHSPPAATPGNSSDARTGHSTITEELQPQHRPMTQRALSVLVVVSAAVIIFFVIRTIRTRKRTKKAKRYGVLNTNIDNMELTPLDQEDEEDDTTLFDANHPRS